jgi:ATP-binding cassette subfamily B protein
LHFLVAWRRIGPWVLCMDPARGRRWVRAAALAADLYRHTASVPAEAWRDYAATGEFLAPLRARLQRRGIEDAAISGLVGRATADPTWRSLAVLDAGARGAEGRGERTAAWLHERLDGGGDGLDPAAWSVQPDGDGGLAYRGAVVLRVRPTEEQQAPVDADLAARVLRAEPSWWSSLRDLTAGESRRRAAFAAVGYAGAAVALAATPVAVERWAGGPELSPWLPLAAGLVALTAWWATASVAGIGRRFDAALRRALASTLGRLPDSFFRSRPVADALERAHAIQRSRDLPLEATRAAAEVAGVLAGTVALVAMSGRPWAVAVGLAALAPVAAVPVLAEREHRSRTVAGALAQHHLDAALGLTAVRSVHGEATLRHEHDALLRTWVACTRSARDTGAAVAGVSGLAGWAALVALLAATAGAAGTSRTLALAAVGVWVLDGGQILAATLQRLPDAWSATKRLLAPLRVPTERPATGGPAWAGPAALVWEDVTVEAAGRPILDRVDLAVGAGEHVAVVGRSGSGKSTLTGLLLGWAEPDRGRVLAGGRELAASSLAAWRRRVAWVDPDSVLWTGPGGDAAASGGEAQRERVGRAWARGDAAAVVLDEPGHGLERAEREQSLAALRRRFAGTTLVCVTHDPSAALGFDRVVVLDAGRIVADGPPPEVMAAPGSPLRALVEAEQRALARLAGADGWRPVSVAAGRVAQPEPLRPAAVRAGAMAPATLPRSERGTGPAGAWIGLTVAAAVAAGVGTARAWIGLAGGGGYAGWFLASAAAAGLGTWTFGRAGVAIGARLRRRLLDGLLAQDVDFAPRRGVGDLFGRILDAEAVERLMLGGQAGLLTGAVTLVLAALAARAAGGALPAALALSIGVVLAMGLVAARAQQDAAAARTDVTGRLCGRMLGHRTELVYGPPAGDGGPARYAAATRRVDRVRAVLVGLIPGAWLAVALALVTRAGPDDRLAGVAAALAGLAGLVLVGEAADDLGHAAAAWRRCAPLFRREGPPLVPVPTPPAGGAAVALRDVGFRYPGAERDALADATLVVRPGERVVVTGPSASGKTTLAGIVGGLRRPGRGSVAGGGVLVPQAGDNHVLLASVACNVLLGRPWPPAPADVERAEHVLARLGLAGVVARMPMGLGQPVGDCGWRLSHGERARLHLARAVLHDPRVVVVDEAFGALDPATLDEVMTALDDLVGTLIVVAHP